MVYNIISKQTLKATFSWYSLALNHRQVHFVQVKSGQKGNCLKVMQPEPQMTQMIQLGNSGAYKIPSVCLVIIFELGIHI